MVAGAQETRWPCRTGRMVRVSHKPDRGWTPKAYKEREIPIPTDLVKSLRTWKTKSDKSCDLVFSTAGCNSKLDFLDCLKDITERAGLNRENFWLRKFLVRLRRGHYGEELISAPRSSGWDTPTLNPRCAI